MAINKVVINRDGVETVLVDITDSSVTPEDMPEGVTAYDKSGEKIEGSMEYMSGANTPPMITGAKKVSEIDGSKYLSLEYALDKRRYIRAGDPFALHTPMNGLGTATAEDVLEGKAFTSVEGVNILGNLWPLGGVFIPESESVCLKQIGNDLCLVLSGKATERGVLGVDDDISIAHPLSDFGDAETADVMSGKTFTSASGLRRIGIGGQGVVDVHTTSEPAGTSDDTLGCFQTEIGNENGLMLLPNAKLRLFFQLNTLGDAKPEDVLAGKEFSSADGVRCVGTFEPDPGSIEVTDDGNGNVTILNAVVTDIDGAITVTM